MVQTHVKIRLKRFMWINAEFHLICVHSFVITTNQVNSNGRASASPKAFSNRKFKRYHATVKNIDKNHKILARTNVLDLYLTVLRFSFEPDIERQVVPNSPSLKQTTVVVIKGWQSRIII